MCALFGALALIPLFLIGKFIHGKEAGLITALLGGISIAFINQSRLAYQDAFLPFFFFFSIYFALRYYFERPERTTYGIRTEWIWLGACVIAVAASLLVRIGQPILLLIALAWMFYSNHEKRTHFWRALNVGQSHVVGVEAHVAKHGTVAAEDNRVGTGNPGE
jgi:asparagine N-glycosylation enzyme membrane subunit Stt3